MKTNFVLKACSVFLMMVAFSCSNELEEQTVLEESNEALIFNSSQEFTDFVAHSSSLSLEELTQKEEALGFKSFARKSEEIYQALENANFTSASEIEQFVSENSEYLKIQTDASGDRSLETNFDNLSKYAMNVDRVYILGNNFFKQFENGLASTLLIDKAELNKHDELEYNNVDSKVIFKRNRINEGARSLTTNCGNYRKETVTNGNNRTIVSVKTGTDAPAVGAQEVGFIRARIRPQKKTFGVWIRARRTIRGHFNIAIEYDNGSGLERIDLYHKFDNKLAFEFDEKSSYSEIDANTPVNFAGYYVFGDTPSTPSALIQCNAEEVCSFFNPCPDPDPAPVDPCAGVSCPNGYECQNGSCVDLCAGIQCVNGYVCVNGNCELDPNYSGCSLNNPCPPGEHCNNGVCTPW
ncbi:EB domain-containing protein [Ekhidna sp.]